MPKAEDGTDSRAGTGKKGEKGGGQKRTGTGGAGASVKEENGAKNSAGASRNNGAHGGAVDGLARNSGTVGGGMAPLGGLGEPLEPAVAAEVAAELAALGEKGIGRGDGPLGLGNGDANGTSNRQEPQLATNLYNVEWTAEEQAVLEEGLQKYSADKFTSLWRYIKIASDLPAKGVRDVALRIRWMSRKDSGKKRKVDDAAGLQKKGRPQKEREQSSRPPSVFSMSQPVVNAPPMMAQQQGGMPISQGIPQQMAAPQQMMGHGQQMQQGQPGPIVQPQVQPQQIAIQPPPMGYNTAPLALEEHGANTVGMVGGVTGELLESNMSLINQVRQNLAACKVNENVELLAHFRDNLLAIMNRMNSMPGLMSQMPQLPVTINANLATSILPRPKNQPGGGPGGTNMGGGPSGPGPGGPQQVGTAGGQALGGGNGAGTNVVH